MLIVNADDTACKRIDCVNCERAICSKWIRTKKIVFVRVYCVKTTCYRLRTILQHSYKEHKSGVHMLLRGEGQRRAALLKQRSDKWIRIYENPYNLYSSITKFGNCIAVCTIPPVSRFWTDLLLLRLSKMKTNQPEFIIRLEKKVRPRVKKFVIVISFFRFLPTYKSRTVSDAC